MDLLTKLASYPRIKLGVYPTPLEPLPRLSAEIGRPIWIKRDDLIGPAPGGNKGRTLEYILGDVKAQGAKRIATFGAMQSNHTRMTAAAGSKLGLETHIYCFEPRPKKPLGNMRLNELYGAHLHYLPLGEAGGGMRLETANRLVRWLARLTAGPNYFIPVGGHSWRGSLGYAGAGLELEKQAQETGLEEAIIVQASGTGSTLAGLMAGLALTESKLSILGIEVGKLWRAYPTSIAHIASELCRQLGAPIRFESGDVPLIEGAYVGPCYGVPSTAGTAAIRRLASTEGILLDPIYTGKAFAALIDLVSKGSIAGDSPLIFLHTGGLPGIFAFKDYGLGLQ